MKRRNFLKRLPIALAPFAIGGIPLRVMADNPLTDMLRQDTGENDNVLIILQMHGGNDGLNALIPVDTYEQYYSRRANIAIPNKNSLRKSILLDSTLPLDTQVSLHPDMIGMKAMYDRGLVGFVQGVSYKNNNGSHFRGRDITFMGGGANDYFDSGWLGRYLAMRYPGYPDGIKDPPPTVPFDYSEETGMPDPLAIEMGLDVSLLFHQPGNIPASITIDNPVAFQEMVKDLEGFVDETVDNRGFPPDFLDPSPYGKEMDWMLKIEDKTKDYAKQLAAQYNAAGDPTVTYPEKYPYNASAGAIDNPLTEQLQIIARLLKGGCRTRLFMIKIGGFDTHADQVESYDPTMGGHAALLYHISSAMKAFYEDLEKRSPELYNKVLTVSTTEFGRRISSNGSFGTDHGTAAPIFMFGTKVVPGIVGTVPNLSPDVHNIEMQYDYRQIYANIMKDWMGVDQAVISSTLFGNQKTGATRDFISGSDDEGNTYSPMPPLIDTSITGIDEFVSTRFILRNCYPNPAKGSTTISFRVNSNCNVVINLMDLHGRTVKTIVNGLYEPGDHLALADLTGLPSGSYIYQMKTLFFKDAKKLVIVK